MIFCVVFLSLCTVIANVSLYIGTAILNSSSYLSSLHSRTHGPQLPRDVYTRNMSSSRRLFDSCPVDDALVADVLSKHWGGAILNERMKSSQNVTYSGTLPSGEVRANHQLPELSVRSNKIIEQFIPRGRFSRCRYPAVQHSPPNVRTPLAPCQSWLP